MAKSFMARTTNSVLLGSTAVLTIAIAVAVTLIPGDGVRPITATAQAQGVSLDVQFRTALTPHGRWQRHDRWGEVWIPARRDRDWRPYTVGRWVYTDEWGWYWDSDEDFGWVTYHYGRWVLEPRVGWIWIPGNEWGPAWVQWRRGDRHAGWAPLPPQQIVYEYDDNPDYWVFVSFNNFTARNIRTVVVPQRERVIYIRETVVVNRTIIVDRGPRIAVNPGIEPTIVAARIGRPIRVATVRPNVVAGTAGVQNAVEIRADQQDRRRERIRAQVTETKETVAPAKEVPPPQALKKGEEGKLGDRPPTAAKETAQQPSGAKGQPDTAKGQPDTTKGPDAAKDAAKTKADDAAKAKDAATTKADDAAKAKDAAKTKADDAKAKDSAKSPVDTKAEPKSQAKDATKTDPAAGAKVKMDDAKAKDAAGAKSKADDLAKGKADDKGKQQPSAGKSPEPDQKSQQKSETRRDDRPDKSQDKQSVMPKAEKQSAPETKQQSAPKGPEPKQAAPQQQEQPRASGPSSPPGGGAPKQDGPKGGGKAKDDEKGKAN
jgi:hypothetical protein